MFRGDPVFALIVAAGRSQRMAGQDKMFAPMAGVPLLARTVAVFLDSPLVDQVVVVLREDCLLTGRRLAEGQQWGERVTFCAGGVRRQDSVCRGLEQMPGEGWVLIHDGARPLVTTALIARGLEAAAATGAAVPGVPLYDTIKLVSEEGLVERSLPRQRLRAAQTPQVFRLPLIREAHGHCFGVDRSFTDDAAMLEALGHRVAVFAGEPQNIKVTTPEDLQRAEALFRAREGEGG